MKYLLFLTVLSVASFAGVTCKIVPGTGTITRLDTVEVNKEHFQIRTVVVKDAIVCHPDTAGRK